MRTSRDLRPRSASAGAVRRARAVLVAAVTLIAAAAPGGARAQGKRAPAPAPAPAVDTRSIAKSVLGSDARQAIDALGTARDAGAAAAAAAPAIEALLERGATVEVAKAAIEALGAIGQGSSSKILRAYSRHRVVEVRREAIKALGATRGAEAIAAFQEGLRSADGIVRGRAASGLGNLGAREAVSDLFAALDRDVAEAAAAIGQLCDAAACARFLDRMGKIGFDVMTSGLDPMLFRNPPLPDALLLDVVARLRALATPEAGKYLADVNARWPASGSAAVKRAIEDALPTMPGTSP